MKKKIIPIIMILFAIIIASLFYKSAPIELTGNLKIHFIDVGQADCILLQLPNNEICLIDAGNHGDKNTIIGYLNWQNIKKIDYLILTHPHEDHIGSAPDVINNFEIGKVYIPDIDATTQIFNDTIDAMKTKNLSPIRARGGEKIISNTDLNFEIFAPNTMYYSELNEYSIVAKLTYEDTSFLFTGDAESVSELEMIRAGYNLDCDLLKVGHHGGRTSTSQDFVNAVTPKYAVIMSETGNNYGHPHVETLNRLEHAGSKIYQTSILGTIVASSDGKNINIDANAQNHPTTVPHSNTNDNINTGTPDKVTNIPPKVIEEGITKYVGNSNSKKFHDSKCSSVDTMKEDNKVYFTDRQSAISQNFAPCGTCKP